jgi:PGF-pre-PGF domain-containing protein
MGKKRKLIGNKNFLNSRNLIVMVMLIGLLIFFLQTPMFSITGNFVKTGTEYMCDGCVNCTAAIDDASSGDTIILNRSINASANCIVLDTVDELTFDCNGSAIMGSAGGGINYGIYLENAHHNTIQNCNVSTFMANPLYIYLSNNNTVQNTTLFGALGGAGIAIEKAVNNSVTNITSHSNSDGGIQFYDANSTFLKNSVFWNNSYGLHFQDSCNNTITNITSDRNEIGIYFDDPSFTNTINDSFIMNNSEQGIKMGISSAKNLFYNNVFNNTLNYLNNSALTNHYNITLTAGTNIINGSWIGGNYWNNWSAPTTGFSEICNDTNGNKICDENYIFGSKDLSQDLCPCPDYDQIDYFPLRFLCGESWTCGTWATCSGSVQARTCTDANGCGTVVDRPIISQSCTDAVVSSGGGGGSVSDAGFVIGIKESQIFDVIIGVDESAIIEIEKKEIKVNEIIIEVDETVEVEVSVEVVTATDPVESSFGLPAGTPYQTVSMEISGFENANLSSVNIDFEVEKNWIEEQNGTTDKIALFRKKDGETEWNKLNTVFVSEDADYYYFTAFTPGFSEFSIFLSDLNCVSGERTCVDNKVQVCSENIGWEIVEECELGCYEKECVEKDSKTLYWIIGSIGILVLFYFIIKFKKKFKFRKIKIRTLNRVGLKESVLTKGKKKFKFKKIKLKKGSLKKLTKKIDLKKPKRKVVKAPKGVPRDIFKKMFTRGKRKPNPEKLIKIAEKKNLARILKKKKSLENEKHRTIVNEKKQLKEIQIKKKREQKIADKKKKKLAKSLEKRKKESEKKEEKGIAHEKKKMQEVEVEKKKGKSAKILIKKKRLEKKKLAKVLREKRRLDKKKQEIIGSNKEKTQEVEVERKAKLEKKRLLKEKQKRIVSEKKRLRSIQIQKRRKEKALEKRRRLANSLKKKLKEVPKALESVRQGGASTSSRPRDISKEMSTKGKKKPRKKLFKFKKKVKKPLAKILRKQKKLGKKREKRIAHEKRKAQKIFNKKKKQAAKFLKKKLKKVPKEKKKIRIKKKEKKPRKKLIMFKKKVPKEKKIEVKQKRTSRKNLRKVARAEKKSMKVQAKKEEISQKRLAKISKKRRRAAKKIERVPRKRIKFKTPKGVPRNLFKKRFTRGKKREKAPEIPQKEKTEEENAETPKGVPRETSGEVSTKGKEETDESPVLDDYREKYFGE